MKAAIFTNFKKPNARDLLEKAMSVLEENGVEVILPTGEPCEADLCFGQNDDMYKQADIIMTIGGDGTIIHHAKKASIFGKPLLGINAGRVGYLAGIEGDELSELSKLVTGDFITEKRMMLKLELACDCDSTEQFYCLNDAVISKGALSRMIDITAEINGNSVFYRADGLIAATPTGSTAYSMSAGGPIIDPSVENIMLTPICPQSLVARSCILNPSTVIHITAQAPDNTEAFVTIDGEQACKLKSNSTVKISRAEDIFVSLIRIKNQSVFKVLSDKLNRTTYFEGE